MGAEGRGGTEIMTLIIVERKLNELAKIKIIKGKKIKDILYA